MQRQAGEGDGVGEQKEADEGRETDESPCEAGEEVWRGVPGGDAVARPGTALDQRHQPGGEGGDQEL
jgi:hypothetical protein